MDDALPTRYGPIDRTLTSRDGTRRLLIVRRTDGHFQMWEQWQSEDDGVAYWSLPMHPLRGVFDSADTAEAEARTWPTYRPA